MTDIASNLLSGFFGAVIGAVLGSFIPLYWSARMRRIERRGEIIAMAAEMHQAYRNMSVFLLGEPLMPLNRLPLTMFERALPKLVGESALRDNEIDALVEYVMLAEDLNRGLDRAAHLAASGEQITLQAEYDRNSERVQHILDEKAGDRTVFQAAESALNRLNRGASWLSPESKKKTPK
jgi:hypothetical protein